MSTSTAQEPQSFSQWNEDRDVWEFFGRARDGFFVEAGANHPITLSQTYLLETQGWKGVLVEPVPECVELLRQHRPRSKIFAKALGAPEQRGPLKIVIPDGQTELAQALPEGEAVGDNSRVIETEVVTLDDVLEQAGCTRLDYLSLDMEGMEIQAMRGLNFKKYQPRFILIEDRNENLDKHRFLRSQGYKIVFRRGSNNWYVPETTPYPVSLGTRLKLLRKLYLSIPFRILRTFARKLRGKT